MRLRLEPNTGAEPLIFGTKREILRQRLSQHPVTKAVEPENDFYTDEGLILGYDRQNELEFIEVFPPSIAEFGELRFFEQTLQHALAKMGEMGLLVTEAHGAYRFNSAGINLYAPKKSIESVSLYRKGYYDNTSAREAK